MRCGHSGPAPSASPAIWCAHDRAHPERRGDQASQAERSGLCQSGRLGWCAGGFLSNENKQGKPLASMPWQDVPVFYAATTDSAMRFMILTAARRGEVIGDENGQATDGLVGNRPERPHLDGPGGTHEGRQGSRGPVVGCGHWLPASPGYPRAPRSGHWAGVPRDPEETIHKFDKLRKGTGITSHGFRSSYTDWVTDTTGDDTIAQLGLAHAVGNKVSRSYRRTMALDKRRESLEAGANFVTGRGGQYGRNS